MEKLDTIAAWLLDKVKSKKEVIKRAERREYSALCCANGHLPSQNSELEPKFQTYKGRVVLRGDIVKNDSGSYAVFTEQGSSASQMTAAKVMDVRARLPGCARQAADAVSAYTQVIMEDAADYFETSQSENVQIFGHVYHGISGQNHGPALKQQLFL